VALKVDLHVHTASSPDCLTSSEDVVLWAQRRQLGALAITDHNSIAGALAVREISPIPIIIGEEIRTRRGEIVGLFLNEEIPPGLTPHETVKRIHQQGGLVYIPHPFDRARQGSALGFGALMEIIEFIDIIEVLNARVTFPPDNACAARLAECYDLGRGAGSDAHLGSEVARAFVEMPAFTEASSFTHSLAEGRISGHTSSPLVHVGSACARLAKSLIAMAPTSR
jgi:predicted metal-dependent phosphoesterase TrpH